MYNVGFIQCVTWMYEYEKQDTRRSIGKLLPRNVDLISRV
jgi:hypothetical protein